MTFEYKVVPAPTRGRKVRGVKTPADRFARALEDAINELAEEGWEYLRTDTLPAEERTGLAGRTTVYQNMLVFRRAVDTGDAAALPERRAEIAALRAAPAADRDAAGGPASANSLDAMIAQEIAQARAPRLPSAGAAQQAPATPVKAPEVGKGKNGLAAE